MEAIYKKGSKFFGMSSGLMYEPDEVREINGCYWHCHAVGQPVVEVGELGEDEGYPDTRTHGGFPQFPKQRRG